MGQINWRANSYTPRPSYNTGVGFFVGTDNKLYDANGVEFRIRGVNRVHYDSGADDPIIAGSYANAERFNCYVGFRPSGEADNISQMQHWIDNGIVPIPGIFFTAGGTTVSGNASLSVLSACVDQWVAAASYYKPLERWMIINIANEWGGNDSDWKSGYITAISRLRAAGYLNTLMIDAGGDIFFGMVNSAYEVFDSDPQRNVMFSFHAYGDTTLANVDTEFAYLDRICLPIVIGEFGPSTPPLVSGPSPTDLTPEVCVTTAETYGFGWMAWGWDDNNLGGGTSNDDWFAMVYNNGTLSLNNFGDLIVNTSPWGLKYTAVKATVFP